MKQLNEVSLIMLVGAFVIIIVTIFIKHTMQKQLTEYKHTNTVSTFLIFGMTTGLFIGFIFNESILGLMLGMATGIIMGVIKMGKLRLQPILGLCIGAIIGLAIEYLYPMDGIILSVSLFIGFIVGGIVPISGALYKSEK